MIPPSAGGLEILYSFARGENRTTAESPDQADPRTHTPSGQWEQWNERERETARKPAVAHRVTGKLGEPRLTHNMKFQLRSTGREENKRGTACSQLSSGEITFSLDGRHSQNGWTGAYSVILHPIGAIIVNCRLDAASPLVSVPAVVCRGNGGNNGGGSV